MELNKLEYANPKKKNFLLVEVSLGNVCNHSCSYCPKILHDGSEGWLNVNDLKRFTWALKTQYPEKDICFKMLGGEPILYPHYKLFTEFLKQENITISIITNGSRTIRWWNDTKDLIDGMSMSFHPEHSDISHFKNVIEVFNGQIPIFVHVLMLPELFEKSCDAFEFILTANFKNVYVRPKVIFPDFGPDLINYTKEELDIIDSFFHKTHLGDVDGKLMTHGEMIGHFSDGSIKGASLSQMLVKQENSFIGWKCFAGVDNLIVDVYGKIFRGQCRVGGKVGNIKDEIYTFPLEPIICDKQFCTCITDMNIRKTKI